MHYPQAAAAILVASKVALSTVPAMARNVNANNLVNVNISNVANDIAKNLSVDVKQVPVTVQVPVGVAATVCDVQSNVLAQGGDDAQPNVIRKAPPKLSTKWFSARSAGKPSSDPSEKAGVLLLAFPFFGVMTSWLFDITGCFRLLTV